MSTTLQKDQSKTKQNSKGANLILNILLKCPSRISLKAHDNRGGTGVTSVSHSTFGGTKLIEAHVPTQGAGCTGAGGHRCDWNPSESRPHSAPDSLKFPAGSAGWRHKPRPLRHPAPSADTHQSSESQVLPESQSEEVLGRYRLSASQ